jgi:hypothetical protein
MRLSAAGARRQMIDSSVAADLLNAIAVEHDQAAREIMAKYLKLVDERPQR